MADPAPGAPPVLVAAAVIVDADDRVLLTQRPAKGHLPGKWEFPGGKVEPGEDPVDALARELREETALEVRAIGILDVRFHRYPSKDVLLLFYEAEILGGTLEHREVADSAWVPAGEVGGWDLPPADAPVVAKIQRRWGGPGGPPNP